MTKKILSAFCNNQISNMIKERMGDIEIIEYGGAITQISNKNLLDYELLIIRDSAYQEELNIVPLIKKVKLANKNISILFALEKEYNDIETNYLEKEDNVSVLTDININSLINSIHQIIPITQTANTDKSMTIDTSSNVLDIFNISKPLLFMSAHSLYSQTALYMAKQLSENSGSKVLYLDYDKKNHGFVSSVVIPGVVSVTPREDCSLDSIMECCRIHGKDKMKLVINAPYSMDLVKFAYFAKVYIEFTQDADLLIKLSGHKKSYNLTYDISYVVAYVESELLSIKECSLSLQEDIIGLSVTRVSDYKSRKNNQLNNLKGVLYEKNNFM